MYRSVPMFLSDVIDALPIIFMMMMTVVMVVVVDRGM